MPSPTISDELKACLLEAHGRYSFVNGSSIESKDAGTLLEAGTEASTYIKNGSVKGIDLTYISKSWSLESDPKGFRRELLLFTHPKLLLPLQGICVPHFLGVYQVGRASSKRASFNLEVPHAVGWTTASLMSAQVHKEAIIEAYRKIHHQGIHHNNLSLRNILIADDGRISIIGFEKANYIIGDEILRAMQGERDTEMRLVKYMIDYNGARAYEVELRGAKERGDIPKPLLHSLEAADCEAMRIEIPFAQRSAPVPPEGPFGDAPVSVFPLRSPSPELPEYYRPPTVPVIPVVPSRVIILPYHEPPRIEDTPIQLLVPCTEPDNHGIIDLFEEEDDELIGGDSSDTDIDDVYTIEVVPPSNKRPREASDDAGPSSPAKRVRKSVKFAPDTVDNGVWWSPGIYRLTMSKKAIDKRKRGRVSSRMEMSSKEAGGLNLDRHTPAPEGIAGPVPGTPTEAHLRAPPIGTPARDPLGRTRRAKITPSPTPTPLPTPVDEEGSGGIVHMSWNITDKVLKKMFSFLDTNTTKDLESATATEVSLPSPAREPIVTQPSIPVASTLPRRSTRASSKQPAVSLHVAKGKAKPKTPVLKSTVKAKGKAKAKAKEVKEEAEEVFLPRTSGRKQKMVAFVEAEAPSKRKRV